MMAEIKKRLAINDMTMKSNDHHGKLMTPEAVAALKKSSCWNSTAAYH
jgi:hypothetical protein